METGEDVQKYLQRTKRVKELLDGFNATEEEVFHEVYIVGEVKDWYSKDRKGLHLHMGFGILPMDNRLGPEASGRPAELVSFDEIGGVKPCPFDIVHVRRVGGWTDPRVSIEIVE